MASEPLLKRATLVFLFALTTLSLIINAALALQLWIRAGTSMLPVNSSDKNCNSISDCKITGVNSTHNTESEEKDANSIGMRSEFGMRKGCGARVPSDTRIILQTVSQAIHRSIELSSLFMNGEKVSHLCKAGKFQCEGIGMLNIPTSWHTRTVNFIDFFSKYWDLKRPVLMDRLSAEQNLYSEAMRRSIADSNLQMPRALATRCVTKLKPVYVIMWAPFCVWKKIAQHPLKARFLNLSPEESEVATLELLMDQHSRMLRRHEAVIVFSYADLLWRQNETLARLERFLPCVGKLSVDYVPQLHVDIVPDGNLLSFAAKNDPRRCCKFDIEKHRCVEGKFFTRPYLIPRREKFMELHRYFTKYSRDDLM